MFDIFFVGNYWIELLPLKSKTKVSDKNKQFWLKSQFLFSYQENPDSPKTRSTAKKTGSSRFSIFFPIFLNFVVSKEFSLIYFFFEQEDSIWKKFDFDPCNRIFIVRFFFEIVLIPLISLSFRLHSSPWKEYWFCHRGVDWTSCFVEGHWLLNVSDLIHAPQHWLSDNSKKATNYDLLPGSNSYLSVNWGLTTPFKFRIKNFFLWCGDQVIDELKVLGFFPCIGTLLVRKLQKKPLIMIRLDSQIHLCLQLVDWFHPHGLKLTFPIGTGESDWNSSF